MVAGTNSSVAPSSPLKCRPGARGNQRSGEEVPEGRGAEECWMILGRGRGDEEDEIERKVVRRGTGMKFPDQLRKR